MVSIPLIPIAAVVAVIQLIDNRWDLWYRPVVLLVVSYFIQWIGHKIEGNDMGEIILIKKALGKPYVAVAHKQSSPASDPST